ncbi:MAG TPA: hypothetical protein VN153_13505, partial [Tahibacter sp.]|nr:hypothetical protein [Tahibacter sp.]
MTVGVGPFTYECTSISKSGPSLTVEFEDQVVTALRQKNTPIKVGAGKMTHVEFVKQLVSEVRWIKFVTVSNPAKYGVV